MTLSITRDQLVAMNPCDLDDHLKLFGRRKVLTAKRAFVAGATLSDLLWVAGRLGLKRQYVEFALACAQRVVVHDTTGTAQPCIDAVRLYMAEPSESNLIAMRVARRAAAYAADAADAADAAARQKEVEWQQALFVEMFS